MEGLWISLSVLGGILVLLLLVGLLGRVRGGRYVRPLFVALAKVPFIRKLMMRASTRAMERQNPELAAALRKIEAFGTPKSPQQAQAALNRLTPAERRAYMEAVREQEELAPQPANRQQRRQMEKLTEPRRAGGGGGRKKSKKRR